MNLEKANQWLSLLANVGVVLGIVFLAFEIRTNTSTNRIAILQNYSSNWMHLHSQTAENQDLAELVEVGLSGQELNSIQTRRFRSWALQYVSQAHDMLRHYDDNLVSRKELVTAFANIRLLAKNPAFRGALIDAGVDPSSRLGGLILDGDDFDRWL